QHRRAALWGSAGGGVARLPRVPVRRAGAAPGRLPAGARDGRPRLPGGGTPMVADTVRARLPRGTSAPGHRVHASEGGGARAVPTPFGLLFRSPAGSTRAGGVFTPSRSHHAP